MDHQRSQLPSSSISDSPWFWAYVFACGGLIALLLMGPKYDARQRQLDRNNRGRIRAAQMRTDREGGEIGGVAQLEQPDESAPGISLRPLFAILLVVITIVFFRFFRSRSTSKHTLKETAP